MARRFLRLAKVFFKLAYTEDKWDEKHYDLDCIISRQWYVELYIYYNNSSSTNWFDSYYVAPKDTAEINATALPCMSDIIL